MRRLHRETPFRGKGAVYSTCTFYEQFLPMATQQRPGQEGSKVHKNLPQQGGHLLQSSLQLGGDAVEETSERKSERKRSENNISNIQDEGKNSGDIRWVRKRARKTCMKVISRDRFEQGRK